MKKTKMKKIKNRYTTTSNKENNFNVSLVGFPKTCTTQCPGFNMIIPMSLEMENVGNCMVQPLSFSVSISNFQRREKFHAHRLHSSFEVSIWIVKPEPALNIFELQNI